MSERSGGRQDNIARAWWTWELQLQLLTETQQKARREWEEEISQPFSAILELVPMAPTNWNHSVSVLYCVHLCMKCSLGSLIFLKKSLIFPILLFSSISWHWSLRESFLCLLAILWNSAFKWVYLSFSPLLLSSLLFTAIWKPSSDSHFALLHFFFLGIVLIPISCTMSWTSW